MRTSEAIAADVIARRDEYFERQKRRREGILRAGAAVIAVLAAAALYIIYPAQRGEPGMDAAEPAGGGKYGIWPVPEDLAAESGDPVTYALLRVQRPGESDRVLNVWTEEEGAGVSCQTDSRKEGVFEADALSAVAAALEEAGMGRFDGTNETGDEGGSAQMQVEFESGETWSADWSGIVPEDFEAAFEEAAEFFEALTAEMPDYEMTFRLEGSVDPALMEEIRAIYGGTVSFSELWVGDAGGENAARLSLPDTSPVLAAAICAPETGAEPYELQIVRLAPGEDPEDVAKSFEENVDWDKWVCVAPNTGWIGIKGDMVLCALGNSDATDTAKSAREQGWREYAKLRPGR